MAPSEEYPELSLSAQFLQHGGKLVPILLPDTLELYTILNPSIVALESHLLMSFRAVNATDYCALSRGMFPDREGPWLSLLNRNQSRYESEHYIANVNSELSIESLGRVEMLDFEQSNETRFHGLEDGRLVHWNKKIYLIGTRHDFKPELGARMECSELEIDFDVSNLKAKEVKRTTLSRPHENQVYGHEKNWAPFANKPFEFARWHNPLQIIRSDPFTGDTSIIFEREKWNTLGELRGGSQIVPHSKGFISIVHESYHQPNYLRQRTCNYLHRFIQWDSKGLPLQVSEQFSLMDMKVEFVSGLAVFEDKIYISFGGSDTTCFVLQIKTSSLSRILNTLTWLKVSHLST